MPATAKKQSTFELQPGVVAELPLKVIDIDPDQPRKDFDEAFIRELAADIAARGVQQPITVRPNPKKPGRYIIKYGENRCRASVVAGKETIPALLSEEDETDPLARLLNQVKENHLRRDLNPIEWATVLRRLRNDHGQKSVTDVVETLKRHGIEMSRPHVSNIMRLAELPGWAQDLLRRGEISPGHGKHLLAAKASEAVLAEIEKNYEADDYRPSVRELQDDIYFAFDRQHECLNGYYARFDYEQECDGCRKQCKVSATDRHGIFCLDAECWKQKQEAALQRRSEEQGNHDTGGDDDPPPAGPAASPPPPAAGDDQAKRVNRVILGHDIARWLKNDALPEFVKEHASVQIMLLVLAIVDGSSLGFGVEEAMAKAMENAGIRVEDEEGVLDIGPLMATRFDPDLMATAALAVLGELDHEHLAHLALRAEIDIDAWRPDAIYLERYTKAELVDLLIEMGVYDEDDRSRLGKLNTDELVERIVEDGDRLDAPEDLREAWEAFIAPETPEA